MPRKHSREDDDVDILLPTRGISSRTRDDFQFLQQQLHSTANPFDDL